jgi:hypothetical protein
MHRGSVVMIAAVHITAESRSITVPSTVLSIYSSLYSSLYSSVPSTVLITVLTHCTRRIHSLIGMNYLSFCSSLQRCTHECSHYCTHHCTHNCTLITVDHCTRHCTRHCLQCPHHVLLFHAQCLFPAHCLFPAQCLFTAHCLFTLTKLQLYRVFRSNICYSPLLPLYTTLYVCDPMLSC